MFVTLRIDLAAFRALSAFARLLVVFIADDVVFGRIVLFVRLVQLIQIKVGLVLDLVYDENEELLKQRRPVGDLPMQPATNVDHRMTELIGFVVKKRAALVELGRKIFLFQLINTELLPPPQIFDQILERQIVFPVCVHQVTLDDPVELLDSLNVQRIELLLFLLILADQPQERLTKIFDQLLLAFVGQLLTLWLRGVLHFGGDLL